MKNSLEQMEGETEKKYSRREKKKKPKMKVSGRSVFKLKEIIKKKGKK